MLKGILQNFIMKHNCKKITNSLIFQFAKIDNKLINVPGRECNELLKFKIIMCRIK